MNNLIICDISGIISIKGKANKELLDTFNTLKNFKCTFCTGRGYRGAYEILRNLDSDLACVCENGSELVMKDGTIIYNDRIEPTKAINLIYDITKNFNFEFLAYIDLTTHRYKFLKGKKKLSEDLTQPWFYCDGIYENANDFLDNIDVKNICRITTRGLECDLTKHKQIFKNFHIVISEGEFHSICNIGINKGAGVKKLAEIYNINLDNIVVIGNDMNDIDMFKLDCGLKIATGLTPPPKELNGLADIYIPLGDLPSFLNKIDENERDFKDYHLKSPFGS